MQGRIVVVTDNEVSRAIVAVAQVLGRPTVVVGTGEGEDPLGELGQAVPVGEDAVVLCDHDAPHAQQLLAAALRSEAGYVAMLASRARAERVLAELEGAFEPERLARLHMPAGLDIGGRTPGEIALSVVAEIVARSHGRPGGPLRSR